MPILFLSFSPTSFLRYPHVAFSHNIINSKTNHLMLCLSCYLSPMYKIQLIPIDTLSSDHNIFISSFISFCLCLTVPPLYLVLFNSTAFAIFSSIYFNPLNLLLLSHLFTSFLFKCTPPLFKITFFPFFFCYFNFSPTTIFFTFHSICQFNSHYTCPPFTNFSQNPLHFQMAMRTVEAPQSQLLYTLLMMNGWWDISILLCQEWNISDFLFLIKNNTRFHLGTLVNLTTIALTSSVSSSALSTSAVASGIATLPYFSSAASSSSSSTSSKSDQQQTLLRQLGALREHSSTTGLVTFGCDIREVRRLWTLVTRMTLPEFHWVLGDSQNVAELRTEGLPLGLLAHGVMGSPSLDHYVHDSLELGARAVGSAAQDNPALALIPGTTNCMDKQQSNGSSGEYLAR